MGYDQTACLVAVAQEVAEGRTRDYHKYRNLNENAKTRKESIRTTNSKRFKNQLAPNDMKILQEQYHD